MWDGFLTVLAVLLESVTWWYPVTVILLWCLYRSRPSSKPNIGRVLFATNTLLLIQSIVWSVTFLIAWLWPVLHAISDGREASAYLPHNGTQFVITSVVGFFIGLIPLFFLKASRRSHFTLPFLIIAFGLLWRAALDLIEQGRISLALRTNVVSLVLYLFVFAGLLLVTFWLTRKRLPASVPSIEPKDP